MALMSAAKKRNGLLTKIVTDWMNVLSVFVINFFFIDAVTFIYILTILHLQTSSYL